MIYMLGEVSSYCSNVGIGPILIIIRKAFDLIQLITPIILLIGLTICFVKLMTNPEEKKYKNIIKNSIIGAVMVYMIPVTVNIMMNVLDYKFDIATCWNSITVYGGESKYIKLNDKKGTSILIDPGEYEKGDEKHESSSSSASIEGSAKSYKDVVWDSSDVTKKSNLTSAQLVKVLNAYGGNATNFIPHAGGLITAENKYSVNVFFLLGVEALESGWVTSPISQKCNNLGGVCASNSRPSNGCGSNSNCNFAYFSSVSEFVDYHASMLHTNYLTPGGSYYHGTSPSAVVTNYCPTSDCTNWARDVTSIADGLFNKVSSVM